MTKIEIVSLIQQKILEDNTRQKNQFTQKNLMLILDTFFDIVKESIVEGEHIELRGFGTFEKKVRETKKAINPRTKESIVVEKHAVPIFRPGKELKEFVRNSTV